MITDLQILDYSSKYLGKNYGGHWTFEISPSAFFWNDDIPLREILVRSDDGVQGYLLVSTSRETPFLITKAFHDDSLTEVLLKRSSVMLQKLNIHEEFFNSLKFYYDPPFNFIIKDNSGLFLDLDEQFYEEKADVLFYLPVPTANAIEIEKEWADLEDSEKNNLDIKEIIHRSGPRYNQAYDSKCEISGCSPVGWACYAGYLKMMGLLPTLFKDSDDWYNDWPTYIFKCATADEQSKPVHDLIWWFNKVMGTQNGSTFSNQIIKGGALFAKFGNPEIKLREFPNCNIQTITTLLQNYAILFGGFRDWQVSSSLSPKLVEKYSAPAGHSVVCHGVRGNEIYVNMGWGEYIDSRWYNLNSITQRHCFGLYK